MTRDFALYIEDIIEAIRKIDEFIGDMSFEDFLDNEMASSAVVLQLIIIGEASKNIPDEIRKNYSGLPWSDMARMRDKIAHSYFSIGLNIVWEVIKGRLPVIEPQLRKMLDDLSSYDDF